MKTGIEFILSDDEQVRVIEYILRTGGKFMPDLWYKEPRYDTLDNSADIMKARDKLSGPIFVVWDGISLYPLEFDRVERHDGVFYFLAQGNGGPYMDFMPCRIKDDGNYLINGIVGYYQRYWLNGVESSVMVPDALKEKYKLITKFIRSLSVKVYAVGHKRIYWVGREAIEMFRNGATTGIELELPGLDNSSLKTKC